MSLQGVGLANALQVLGWLELPSPAEDLQDGVPLAEVAEGLRSVGEGCAARVLLAAAADTTDRIVGRPLVHVVPSDKHPAAVFGDSEQAERYAAAAGEGWQPEHAIVADDETADALIDEALRGDA